MAQVRNIHGQGRQVGGEAVGGIFVDFGAMGDNRYVRFRVTSGEDGRTIRLAIDGEMCAHFNDAPALEIEINRQLVLDTSETAVAQPHRELPPRE